MKKNKEISGSASDYASADAAFGFFNHLDNTAGRPVDDASASVTRIAASSDMVDPDVALGEFITIDDPLPEGNPPKSGWLEDYRYETSVTTDSNGNTVYAYSTSWKIDGVVMTSSGSDTYAPDGLLVGSEWSDSSGSHGSTTVTTDASGNTIYSYSSTYVEGETAFVFSSTDVYSPDGTLVSSEWADSSGSHGSTTVTTDASGNTIYSYISTWADGENVVTTTSTDIYGVDGDLISSIWSDTAGNSGSTTVTSDADGNTVYAYTSTWVDGGAAFTSTSVDIYSTNGDWISSNWSDSTGNHGSVSVNDKIDEPMFWLGGDVGLAADGTVELVGTPRDIGDGVHAV